MEWKNRITALIESDEWPDWLLKIMVAARDQPKDRRKVSALSGGKDSTAFTLAQAYFEPGDYEYVITPTGDELPDMVAHWDLCAEMLGKPLHSIGFRTLQGLIVELKMLPNHTARWCTRKIKLEPYYQWLGTLGAVVSYVGLRSDEQSRPGMIFPSVDQIEMNYPMQRWGWTLDDVLAFLSFLNIKVPERSDCALCFWQKLGEWYLLWRDHRDRYERGIELESFVTMTRGSAYTFRSPERDSWPASLADLATEFEKGRIPTRSLKMMDARREIGACRVCTL